MACVRDGTFVIDNDVDITAKEIFDEVETLATKYALDVADAYQLVTLKRGMFSKMTDDSQPILVTADRALAGAARGESMRAWECLHEPAP